MIMQLKDVIDISTILSAVSFEDGSVITYVLGNKFSQDDTNAVLYDMFVTNNQDVTNEYLINRLDKYFSPLLQRLYDYYYGIHHDNRNALLFVCNALADIIFNKFFFNWNKLAEGFFADYNPIHNYDMTENEGSSLNTKLRTETKDTQKYAGFNSGTTLPVATEGEGSSETSGTQEFNNSARELTRSGNIGVTTTAQMLTQEFELRKRTLLDTIYNDIDSILFLDYYK